MKDNLDYHSIDTWCKIIIKFHSPFNNDPLFPSPTDVPKRSPAPEDMPEISEKFARLEWFGVPIPLVIFAPVHNDPPGGGEVWCNPGVPEFWLL